MAAAWEAFCEGKRFHRVTTKHAAPEERYAAAVTFLTAFLFASQAAQVLLPRPRRQWLCRPPRPGRATKGAGRRCAAPHRQYCLPTARRPRRDAHGATLTARR